MALALACVGSFVLKSHLADRYNPNDDDVDVRIERGRRRAMSRKQYARLAPRKAKGAHQKIRPEDLA